MGHPAFDGELYSGDLPMPRCAACRSGRCGACADLIFTEPYGLHACGCPSPVHEED